MSGSEAMTEHNKRRWNAFLETTLAILWAICRPIGIAVYAILHYLVVGLLFVLKQLYRPVAFLLQPFVYLGRFITACLIAPFRILVKFETLYIYLGIAAIIGLAIGLTVGYVYGSLANILRLNSPADRPPVRTAKQYRQAKRDEKLKAEAPLLSPVLAPPNSLSPSQLSPTYVSMSEGARKGKRSKGLLNQTIMEEVDSDY